MSTLVYKFGSPAGRPPIEGADLVSQTLLLAHRYQNKLIEIERKRREEVAKVLGVLPRIAIAVQDALAVPDDDDHKKERMEAWNLVYKLREIARKAASVSLTVNDEPNPEKHAKKEEERTKAVERAIREEVFPDRDILGQISGVWEATKVERLAARRNRGPIPWGTYLLYEEAVDAASKTGTLHFKRWDGTGRIGVRIHKSFPFPTSELFDKKNNFLQLERIPDRQTPGRHGLHKIPGSRRFGRSAIASLRIGSNEHMEPIWARWLVTLHRPLPEGMIKQAWMQRERIGPDYRWFLCVTVSMDAPRIDAKAIPNRSGIVSIQPGWRSRQDEGRRVGYWVNDAGEHGELLLPLDLIEKLDHARSIGSIRKTSANEFQERLVRWIAGKSKTDLSDWFREETKTISQWKSSNRLYYFACRWAHNRFPGDEEIFDRRSECELKCKQHVECWRRDDRHLHAWCAHETAKTLGRREEIYRLWAVHFARTYGTVVLMKFKQSELPKNSEDATYGERRMEKLASSQRHDTAAARFQGIIVHGCRSRMTTALEVSSSRVTITCIGCGFEKPWDKALRIKHECERCGTVNDQDYQACVNMLKRAASGTVVPGTDGPLEKVKSARQRRYERRWNQKEKVCGTVVVGRSKRSVQANELTEE